MSTQRGSVLPLLAAMILLVGVLASAVARLGSAAVARAQARTAADAAALAGAADGRAAAGAVAEANDAHLDGYEERGRATEVVVRVGRARAVARAEREVPAPSSAPRPTVGSAARSG